MARQKSRPAYTLHRQTGQARVGIDGRDHYLGQNGSPSSRDRYDDLAAEWLTRQDTSKVSLTVDDLVLLYVEHADAYYRNPDGKPTREAENIRIALRPLVRLYGRTRVRDFGPKLLRQVRDYLIAAGNSRSYINAAVGKIKRMFKWGAAEELVPESVWQKLQAVDGLRAGRTKARESIPVSETEGRLGLAAQRRRAILSGQRGARFVTQHPQPAAPC